MAKFFEEPSRTFSEYLLIPGYTGPDCTPDKVEPRREFIEANSKKVKNLHYL